MSGSVEVKCGSGSAVELVLNLGKVGFGVVAEVGAFFKPEPQETVGVFVAAALPR